MGKEGGLHACFHLLQGKVRKAVRDLEWRSSSTTAVTLNMLHNLSGS